jgi:hypothetical protein
MVLEMSYDSLLCNTCDLEHNSFAKWGEPQTPVIESGARCRIEYSNRLIRNFKGEEVLSIARVFFLKIQVISEIDRLFFGGIWHGIQRIDRVQAFSGIHHIEVWVD